MRFLRWAIAALSVSIAFAAPAGAGDYRLFSLGGGLVKWGKPALGTGASVTYAFVTEAKTFPGARNCAAMAPFAALAPAAGASLDRLRRETQAAFAEWEKAAAITFRQVDRLQDADIVIGSQAVPVGWAFSNVTPLIPAAARTVPAQKAFGDEGDAPELAGAMATSHHRINGIRQSLICLNPAKPWKIGFNGNLKVYDIRYTLAHEIGHAIGLDHPGAGGALMGFRYDERISGPQASDIAAVQRLYGQPLNQ